MPPYILFEIKNPSPLGIQRTFHGYSSSRDGIRKIHIKILRRSALIYLTFLTTALERVSYILGIYKALNILLPNEQAADAWVRCPNTAPLFGGKSALDRMLLGKVSDLYVVRQYLDAQRGGWA